MQINIFSQADFIFNKKNSFPENLKLLACNNGHVFFVGSDLGKEIMLYNYNEIDLSSNKSKEIKYPEIDGERSKYLDVLYFRNKIILFTTISNKDTKEYSLIATQIDENGDVVANGKIIDKIYLDKIDIKSESTIEDLARHNTVPTLTAVFRNIKEKLPSWILKSPIGDLPMFMIVAKHGKIKFNENLNRVKYFGQQLYKHDNAQ